MMQELINLISEFIFSMEAYNALSEAGLTNEELPESISLFIIM